MAKVEVEVPGVILLRQFDNHLPLLAARIGEQRTQTGETRLPSSPQGS